MCLASLCIALITVACGPAIRILDVASRTGYVVLLNGAAVSWQSTCQHWTGGDIRPTLRPDDGVDDDDVDEMEGIELRVEAEDIKDGTESGLTAFCLGFECSDDEESD